MAGTTRYSTNCKLSYRRTLPVSGLRWEAIPMGRLNWSFPRRVIPTTLRMSGTLSQLLQKLPGGAL